MYQQLPLKQLFLIMAGASLLISALSIASLYHTATEQHRLRLTEIAKSQARLIEAIAQYNQLQGSEASVMSQIADAHRQFEGFGESGEFTLARQQQNEIVFVLSRRHQQSGTPRSIPFDGLWAEPMRQALLGRAGIMTGLDYRGVQVLAAYEPIAILDLGLVAKIDIAEIQAPFIRAAVIAVALAFLIILIASRIFFRISRPYEDTMREQAETFRTLAETAREGIILADTHGKIQFVNGAAQRLFGYHREELLGQSLNRLMPMEYSRSHDRYLGHYLKTGEARIIGIGRELTAMRKDGSRFPIYLSVGDINLDHSRMFAGVIMDMSEQHQLQREILEIPVNEQRRIGQELHDGLGQQLTGLGMLATSLVNKAGKPEFELASKLANGLQQAVAQVRSLSRGLMPVSIDAAGLMAALENLVDEVRAQCDVSISLDIAARVHVADNSAALHLYRIAQEAVNNAVKHASASRVRLSLDIVDGRGQLLIEDDGAGIDSPQAPKRGLGLRIMKHRCSLIDAELRIDSSTEQGTRVQCLFPIEETEK